MVEHDVNAISAARERLLRGESLVERCHACLLHRPAAVVTDIDGTISDIAETPSAAIVDSVARDALARLSSTLELVGVVTGRAAADGEQLVNLPNLLYVGNHGLEQRSEGESTIQPDALRAIESLANALEDVQREMAEDGRSSGLIFENKRLSASIHFRLADDPDETGRRLHAVALSAARRHGLRVTDGRFVVELRPQVTVNKGTAVTELVEGRHLRGMVFLGDDLTDVDAFRVVRRLSRAGHIAGCVVAVASPEVHPTVLNEADGLVEGVGEAAQLLSMLADKLAPPRP